MDKAGAGSTRYGQIDTLMLVFVFYKLISSLYITVCNRRFGLDLFYGIKFVILFESKFTKLAMGY